jgi:subtilisin family serine protease
VRYLCLFALGVVFTLSNSVSIAAPPPNTKTNNVDFVPFEVIVKFKPGTKTATVRSQIPGLDIKSVSRYVTVAKLNIPSAKLYTKDAAKTQTLALLNTMRKRNDVQYAQLNHLSKFAFSPNDPLYTQQWHYPLVSLPSAWDVTRGNRNIQIAILDSGRSNHPDLNGQFSVLEFNAFSPGVPATDDGTWRHGTHVAGIAGAASNNGNGGAGVCHNCQLLNVKIGDFDSISGIPATAIVNAIHWATDNGANVINMSFESPLACTSADFPAYRDAIARAIDNGVTLIASAGNNAVNVDNVSPASCPGVISVAATDRDNNLANYSSRGPNIGISAPGGADFYGAAVGCPEDRFSAFNPNDFSGVVSSWTTSPAAGNSHCYRHLGGTSMSAPHVSGTVGLILSVNAKLRPDQVRSLIRNSASALPNCGTNCGPGLLNAFSAVSAAQFTSTGPCSARNTANCRLDSMGQYIDNSGVLVELIFAYGYLWQLDANGNQIGVAKKLRALPRYSNGPCAYTPAGEECTIDSATLVNYPGFGYIESVSAYGRFWNFDQNGNGLEGNGALLSSVSRYAAGPCSGANPADCRFDTRNLINAPEWGGVIESITAYGRYWLFDANGNLIASDSLFGPPRYANGPCLYAPAGQNCVFDTRELHALPGGGFRETITAYGRYFEWDRDVPTANHDKALTAVSRLL